MSDQLTNYVSNLDGDIYTVSNIPEEVVAVIFAYVSRSAKSFRENIETVIKEEQMGQENATKFHEKWVLQYGHSSVAEHATVHIGIEKVSRLFSSLLELSNEYLSFTEYSQRYQRPRKGDFYVPMELKDRKNLKKQYKELYSDIYDTYIKLNSILLEYLKLERKTDNVNILEKLAFEDARYILNLSTYTNLGMTANSRAIEDALSLLLSSKYSEVRYVADRIKQEVRYSVPTLVKYADEKDYIIQSRKTVKDLSTNIEPLRTNNTTSTENINLINWTGKNEDNPQGTALKPIIKALLYEHSGMKYNEVSTSIESNTYNELLCLFKEMVKHLGKHDNPTKTFKFVDYEAEFTISEACWHQLLRHRKVNWIYSDPSIYNGITIPPNIKKAGAEDLIFEAIQKSEMMYEKLMNEGLDTVAPYVVTNAHNRQVIGKFDLWELFHLVNVRTSESAQWDIKNIVLELVRKIEKHHPDIVKYALHSLSD